MDKIFEEKMAFNFYRSYYETSLLLSQEDKVEFLEAILHYQFTGEVIEPKTPFAILAFRGQMHSLSKQVTGFIKGKSTYPTGNPTKGRGKVNYKGKGKQVQVQEKEEVKEKEEDIINKYCVSFSKIKDFQSTLKSFPLNKKYFYLAYRFWELWFGDQETETLKNASVHGWYKVIRLMVERDNQSIDRLISLYEYFKKCRYEETGFDTFWYNNIKSVGGLRDKDKDGVYRLDKIMTVVNQKIKQDPAFGQLVFKTIANFKKYESDKLLQK